MVFCITLAVTKQPCARQILGFSEIALYLDSSRDVNVFHLLFFLFVILHIIAFCNYNTCYI